MHGNITLLLYLHLLEGAYILNVTIGHNNLLATYDSRNSFLRVAGL